MSQFLTWINILSIVSGGAIGALLRALTSFWVLKRFPESSYLGTLSVNLMGCFLIGVMWTLFEQFEVSFAVRLCWITGGLGAFTTFSTFGLESMTLLSEGKIKLALGYILISNILGVFLVVVGAFLAKALFLVR